MNITIGGSSLSSGSVLQNGQLSVATQTKKEKEGQQAQSANYDAISIQGDTLSLSQDGKAAAEALAQVKQDAALSGTDTEDSQLLNALTSEEDSDSSDLSSYTTTELKEMYLNGEITKEEYEAELKSRQASAE
jgi:hypothetical protein